MSTKTGNPECYVELSTEFSSTYIAKFAEVFKFFKDNAVDNTSLIRKLHLGYTAMRPEAFEFVALHFPWIEDFRIKYGLDKKLNFLETHGLYKKEFQLHIDGRVGDPSIMFNAPIINCTADTETYWVLPEEDFIPVLSCKNGDSRDTKQGATPHLPTGTKYTEIARHSFTDKCALFRSDVYHGVTNNSAKDEYRIMMHWWFPGGTTWDETKYKFKI